jgi:hypothetical protein
MSSQNGLPALTLEPFQIGLDAREIERLYVSCLQALGNCLRDWTLIVFHNFIFASDNT